MDENSEVSQSVFHIWEGVYASFKTALAYACGPGFEGEIYRKRSLKAAADCIESLSTGLPIPAFYKQRSTLLPLAVAMILCQEERADILDFGGGLGIGFMTLQESIPMDLHRLKYTIIEGTEVSALGSSILGDKVNYVASIPTSGRFQLIHAASSLQYIDDWRDLLCRFASLKPSYILLTDVFAGHIDAFVTLQNYYDSRIPHWFLNLAELLESLSGNGYELRMQSYATSRRLDIHDSLPMDNLPETCHLPQTLNLLFQKRSP